MKDFEEAGRRAACLCSFVAALLPVLSSAAIAPRLVTRAAFPAGAVGTTTVGQTSADGRYTVFTSDAVNLVPGQVDDNAADDVFLYDAVSGTTTLVSGIDGGLTTPTGASTSPVISADGAYVAFATLASDIKTGVTDTNFATDVYVYARTTGALTLVSRAAGGSVTADGATLPVQFSADGTYLLLTTTATNLKSGVTDTNGSTDVYQYNQSAATMFLVSSVDAAGITAGAGQSDAPSMSADGSFVAFQTTASTIKTGITDTNGASDIYVYARGNASLALVSAVDGGTTTGSGASTSPKISGSGGYVAFTTLASDLKTGVTDTNGVGDAWLWNRAANVLQLASAAAGSTTTANGATYPVAINSTGDFLVLNTAATDLKSGIQDLNGQTDLYLYTRSSGATTLISAVDGGTRTGNSATNGASISDDGNVIAFNTYAFDLKSGVTDKGFGDIYLYKRLANSLTLVTAVDAGTTGGDGYDVEGFVVGMPYPVLSADGKSVYFASDATTLVSGDHVPASLNLSRRGSQLYRYSTTGPSIARITREASGMTSQAAAGHQFGELSASADGRYVVFASTAINLVPGQVDRNRGADVFLYDTVTGAITLVSAKDGTTTAGDRESYSPVISRDGRYIAFGSEATDLRASITGAFGSNVYLYERVTGTLTLVSGIDGGNVPANSGTTPTISSDGRYVAFATSRADIKSGVTDSNTCSDIYLWDRASRALTLVSGVDGGNVTSTQVGSFGALFPMISADGSRVAFSTDATDLKSGVTDPNGHNADIYVYTRASGTLALVTGIDGGATTGDGYAFMGSISGDGSTVTFVSTSSNLKTGVSDANGGTDVFAYDPGAGTLTLLSGVNGTAATGNHPSSLGAVSNDGRIITFSTQATDLEPTISDVDSRPDTWLYDRSTGTRTLLSRAGTNSTSNGFTMPGPISPDGMNVVLYSSATNLLAGVSNPTGQVGVYVLNRGTGTVALLSGVDGSAVVGGGSDAVMSDDGQSVHFLTGATNLESRLVDYNGGLDLYRSVPDRTPDPFSFANQADVAPGTEITSAPVTISGTDSDAPVTVGNGSYSIGCTSSYVTTDGTIAPGGTVCVRHTSSVTGGQSVTTTLAIGGVTGTFTSTTIVPPPQALGVARAAASPTNASSVSFTATFDRAVTGVDAADFTVAVSGISGAGITGVSGSGSTYTVTVGTGSGSGSLELDLVDNDSIVGASDGKPLGGAGSGGGLAGETYAIDRQGPVVTINQGATQADPASSAPVIFEVQFSEAVTGFDAGDVILGGTAAPATATIGGGPSAYTVNVSGMTANGTVTASIAAGAVTDVAGNPGAASTTTDNTVTFQGFTPTVAFTTATRVVTEGSGAGTTSVTVTATLSQSSTLAVAVPVSIGSSSTATSDDYNLMASQFSFAPGALSDSFTVTIVRDSLDEANETLVLALGTPVNATLAAPASQTITINDDDATPTVDLSVTDTSLAEKGGTATITATLSAVSGRDVVVPLGFGGAAVRGQDYVVSPTQVTIPAGSTSATFAVTALDDSISEGNETFVVTLAGTTNAVAGSSSSLLFTIVDDEPAPAAVTGQEKGGALGEPLLLMFAIGAAARRRRDLIRRSGSVP